MRTSARELLQRIRNQRLTRCVFPAAHRTSPRDANIRACADVVRAQPCAAQRSPSALVGRSVRLVAAPKQASHDVLVEERELAVLAQHRQVAPTTERQQALLTDQVALTQFVGRSPTGHVRGNYHARPEWTNLPLRIKSVTRGSAASCRRCIRAWWLPTLPQEFRTQYRAETERPANWKLGIFERPRLLRMNRSRCFATRFTEGAAVAGL